MKFWWNWRKRDEELEKEIQHHLRMAKEERVERGASVSDARAGARREFGNTGLVKELARDVWGWRWVQDAVEDARYGLRMLVKSPGSTAAVIVALALGIGVNTTVFSFVNALLLRPPALVRSPGRLLEVWLRNPRSSGVEGYLPLTYPDYIYYRDHSQSYEGMLAFDGDPHLVTWNKAGEGQIVLGQLVSGNFFSLLGVSAVLGRTISPEDDHEANPRPVVVLGHAFWRQHLGSDPATIGKTLVLNGTSYSVIGVMPAGFTGLLVGFEPDFWAPLTMVKQVTRDTGRLTNWQGHWLFAAGRLKPDASANGARAEASVLSRQIETDHPELKRNLEATVFPTTLVPGPYRIYVSAFTALLMAVFVLVLLIACANVASFLLARATVRAREMAVRSALGAGRGRLIRQMLVESTLFSVLAGLVGLIFAYWTAPLLVALKPASLPITLRLPIDWRVLAFTLMVSLICGVAFGLPPALRSTRVQVASNLKEERQSASYRKSRLRSFLMAGQIATCTVLLVGATLCVRSLRNASSINPGFNAQHVVAAALDPESLGYSAPQVRAFYDQLLEHVLALPGVTAASFTDHLPLGTNHEGGFVTDVGHPEVNKSNALFIGILRIAPDYFQTMGISLLRGRDFTSPESVEGSGVAIINEALAKRLWKNQDPMGRRFNFFGEEPSSEVAVVGVVPTGKYRTLGEDPLPVVYLPQLRARRTLVARTSGEPATALESIRHEIYAVDPKIAATDLETMQQYMSLPLFPARTTGLLLGVSGGMALALTVIGLFGVISYVVFQRTHEIGVRVALGAQRSDILNLVVRHGLVLTAIGLATGLGIAFGATRLLSSLLYGIAATDPTTFIGVAALLCLVTLLACYLPARRAMRVDPVVALRYE